MNNDLISRSAAVEMLREKFKVYFVAREVAMECASEINNMPAVDAEVVRHGCWIPNKVGAIETQFKCSECDRTITLCNDYFAKATKYASCSFPYCHCGCKMDVEVEW